MKKGFTEGQRVVLKGQRTKGTVTGPVVMGGNYQPIWIDGDVMDRLWCVDLFEDDVINTDDRPASGALAIPYRDGCKDHP